MKQPALTPTEELENRIQDLEIKLAFQEDLIDALNSQVSNQNVELSKLSKSFQLMHNNLHNLHNSMTSEKLEDELPPPHY